MACCTWENLERLSSIPFDQSIAWDLSSMPLWNEQALSCSGLIHLDSAFWQVSTSWAVRAHQTFLGPSSDRILQVKTYAGVSSCSNLHTQGESLHTSMSWSEAMDRASLRQTCQNSGHPLYFVSRSRRSNSQSQLHQSPFQWVARKSFDQIVSSRIWAYRHQGYASSIFAFGRGHLISFATIQSLVYQACDPGIDWKSSFMQGSLQGFFSYLTVICSSNGSSTHAALSFHRARLHSKQYDQSRQYSRALYDLSLSFREPSWNQVGTLGHMAWHALAHISHL